MNVEKMNSRNLIMANRDCESIPELSSLFLYSSPPKLAPETKIVCPSKCNKTLRSVTNNLMTDPRVRRGAYIMELGPTDDSLFYPCFEMVRRDPMCQLYLRRSRFAKCPQKEREIKVTANKFKILKTEEQEDQQLVIPGKEHSNCQTDVYYEYLRDEPLRIIKSSQTDSTKDTDFTLLGLAKHRRPKIGDDKETQVYPGELWRFGNVVVPVVTNVVAAVIEQSLLELMLENELEMLMDQQRKFENRKAVEIERLQRLQQRQHEMIVENELKKKQEIIDFEELREAGELITTIAFFTRNYINYITSGAMDQIERDGALTESPLVAWINPEIKQTLIQNRLSKAILNDIIHNVVLSREQENDFSELFEEEEDYEYEYEETIIQNLILSREQETDFSDLFQEDNEYEDNE